MGKLRICVLTVGLVSMALPALAKGSKGASAPTHHCMKDGAEVAGATKKSCKKQGGTWEKMAAGTTAPAPGAGATTSGGMQNPNDTGTRKP